MYFLRDSIPIPLPSIHCDARGLLCSGAKRCRSSRGTCCGKQGGTTGIEPMTSSRSRLDNPKDACYHYTTRPFDENYALQWCTETASLCHTTANQSSHASNIFGSSPPSHHHHSCPTSTPSRRSWLWTALLWPTASSRAWTRPAVVAVVARPPLHSNIVRRR